MTLAEESEQIVPPVDVAPADQVRRGPANPAALTTEQLARMLGIDAEKVRDHVAAGAPTGPDGRINLVHYAAWLNREMTSPGENDGD